MSIADSNLAKAAAELDFLRGVGATLATAESLTGGGLGSTLTSVPGASVVYVGGVITYATRLKVALLGVPTDVVASHGVVSQQCAVAMAEGVRDRLSADVGLSTTGVAGPNSQEGKPVGRVYVAVADQFGVECRELNLSGDRDAIRVATIAEALNLLALRNKQISAREVVAGE